MLFCYLPGCSQQEYSYLQRGREDEHSCKNRPGTFSSCGYVRIFSCVVSDVSFSFLLLKGGGQKRKLHLTDDSSISDVFAFIFNSCGGVEVYNDNGKIKVSNTLESRIELIAQQVE